MNSNLYKISEVTQRKYCQVPKELYTNPRYKTTINNDAKMLYALLLDRMELSRTNGWIEDDGTIFLILSARTWLICSAYAAQRSGEL